MAPSKAVKKQLGEEKKVKEARKVEPEVLLARNIPSDIARKNYTTELAEIVNRLPEIDALLGVRPTNDGPSNSSNPQSGSGGQAKPVTGDYNEDEVVEPQQEVRPKTLKEIGIEGLDDRVTGLKLTLSDSNAREKMPLPNVKATQIKDPVELKANYFLLGPDKDQTLHRYSVKIMEKTTSARMRRRVLYLLLEQHKSSMDKAATDYHQTLFSTVQFQNHPTCQYFVVNYYGEGETQARQGDKEKLFTVVSVYQKSLPINDLSTFLSNSLDPTLPNGFNAEYRRPNQNPKVQHAGPFLFFDTRTAPADRRDLRGGLEAYIGFVRSVRVSQARLLININAKGSAFYTNTTLDYIIHAWTEGDPKIERENWNMLEKFIKGNRVQARHGTKRVYTVFGLAPWESERPTSEVAYFWRKEKDKIGKETGKMKKMFVRPYFNKVYPGVHKWFTGLVVNCGSATDQILIPDDCLTVLEGSRYRRLLEGNQTDLMQDLASVRPAVNKQRIMDNGRPLFGIGAAEDTDSPSTRFGLSLSPELLSVQGRSLPSPKLISGNAKFHEAKEGGWDLKKALQHKGKMVIRGLQGKQKEFFNRLVQGVQYWCPNLKQGPAMHSSGFFEKDPEKLKDILRPYRKADTRLLFVALPNDNISNYELLKYVSEVDFGMHTVCTVKCTPQVIPSLMLKCSLKLGGDSWHLSEENRKQVPKFLSPTTMVVGADVTHPSPGSMDDVDSVAAVVASVNNGFNHYPASFRCQASKMEMIDEFDTMLEERLKLWKKLNGGLQYPTHIIVYRDGVSESQFDKVLELEYPQVRSVIKDLYGTAKQKEPGVTMLSVQKRHHTRFYPEGKTNTDKDGNAQPGLLVDRGVTYADKYNWFLQSHKNLLGTARPAHYVVLANTIDADVDELHKATHWQCFLYGRCSKSISIHPAARLADRAWARARAYLREYYVAGNRCNETFDRNGAHADAWDPTRANSAFEQIKDSMFYI